MKLTGIRHRLGVPIIEDFTVTNSRYPKVALFQFQQPGDCGYPSAQRTHVEVALEQGGVDDLQQLLLGLDGGSAFHERGRAGLVVRVIQLLHQLASFLPRPRTWDQGQG